MPSIAGKRVSTDEVIEVRNPYDNVLVGTVPMARPEHVREAFAKARAFKPKLSRYERQQILLKTAEVLASRREEFAAARQVRPERIATRPVCHQFNDDGSVENDHLESRNSRITAAELRLPAIGLNWLVRSSHSVIVGFSSVRSSSRFRKSDKFIPSRAARDLRTLWTWSVTPRI